MEYLFVFFVSLMQKDDHQTMEHLPLGFTKSLYSCENVIAPAIKENLLKMSKGNLNIKIDCQKMKKRKSL